MPPVREILKATPDKRDVSSSPRRELLKTNPPERYLGARVVEQN